MLSVPGTLQRPLGSKKNPEEVLLLKPLKPIVNGLKLLNRVCQTKDKSLKVKVLLYILDILLYIIPVKMQKNRAGKIEMYRESHHDDELPEIGLYF